MKKGAGFLFFGLACFVLGALLSLPGRGAAQAPASGEQTETIQAAVGTAFTYQGYLLDNQAEANGVYDFRFMLFDAASGGAQIGSTVTLGDVTVKRGIFTVELNFGTGAFGGGARWLVIGVRPGSSGGSYTSLTPRQKLNSAPYAQALPNVFIDESNNFVGIGRNFRISGNEVFGVRYTGVENQYGGMYVETSNAQGWPFYGYATNGSFRAWSYYNGSTGEWILYNGGVRLKVPATGGLRIGPSVDYSLVISNTTSSDGIRVLDTGDDAIQIGSNPDIPNYGVYIPSPGVSTYGLWSNTSNASGEWALYTVDKVSAGNVAAAAYTMIAKVSGTASLSAGDVVAVSGMAEPIPGSVDYLPQVVLADSTNSSGVIGVVSSRMLWEVAPGKEQEGEFSLHSAEGPAKPGEYVALIVSGVTAVKVDSGALIQPGDRLTASAAPGTARSLQTQEINGMLVTEGAPVFGIALEAPSANKATIYVFVTLR